MMQRQKAIKRRVITLAEVSSEQELADLLNAVPERERKKTKRFKYYLPHNAVKRTLASIKTFHQLMLQAEIDGEKNPYVTFRDWLLEIVQYGMLITVVYMLLFSCYDINKLLKLVPASGIVRWLLFDAWKELKEK